MDPVADILNRVADDAALDALPTASAVRRSGHRRRRRARARIALIATTVALLAVGAFIVVGPWHASSQRRVEPLRPAPGAPPTRALTYAQGQTIHWGEHVIDAGRTPTSLHVTDDGVAFTAEDGQVWFADGRSLSRIGTARGAGLDASRQPELHRAQRLSSGNVGSRLVWFDDADGTPEMVVYDTRTHSAVHRPAPHPSSWDERTWEGFTVTFDDVAYAGCDADTVETCPHLPGQLIRHDLITGDHTAVSDAELQRELRARPRMLVFGVSSSDGRVGPGPGADFRREGRHLVPLRDRDWSPGHRTSAFTPGRDAPLELRLPRGYSGPTNLHLFEWLGDDTVALWTGNDLHGRGPDLITCVLSTGSCEVAVTASGADLLPGMPGKNF